METAVHFITKFYKAMETSSDWSCARSTSEFLYQLLYISLWFMQARLHSV